MSARQSNLSSPAYGYDFVVATTQASLNATLKQYLSATDQPEAVLCYVSDANGRPTPIDYDTLVRNASGSDPFSVPADADPATSQELKNLFAARFVTGFRARLGLPPGYAPADFPDIVKLGSNTVAVTFSLMCSEFQVVHYTPASGYGAAQWLSTSQPAGGAWLFRSQVNLSLAPTGDFGALPTAVQAQIKNLGGTAFSVQQLLFDLDSAVLESAPVISGVEPETPLYEVLQRDFVGRYFNAMRKKGSPLLCYAVKPAAAPASTLVPTDLAFWSSPFVGISGQPVVLPIPAQQSLYTLNYLCATGGRELPAPAHFTWNWVDPAETADYQGVVAIRRGAFAEYLKAQLDPVVAARSYQPTVYVPVLGAPQFSLGPGRPNATVTRPAAGPVLLSYAYVQTASDQAGPGGMLGRGAMAVSFELSASVSGNAISIVQHLVVTLGFSDSAVAVVNPFGVGAAVGAMARVVDRTITDTYTLGVDASGRLATARASSSADHAQEAPGVLAELLSGGVAGLLDRIGDELERFTSTNLTDTPLSVVQDFVFPGGYSFVFKDAGFSDHQDLVAHITYADPS